MRLCQFQNRSQKLGLFLLVKVRKQLQSLVAATYAKRARLPILIKTLHHNRQQNNLT